MKILILADPAAAHTKKWVNGLLDKGLDIYLFGLRKEDYHEFPNLPLSNFFSANFGDSIFNKQDGTLDKLKYLKYVSIIRKIIKQIKPDVLHAHYASSYGLLGALTGFHPYIVSVWGMDIYNFPRKNKLYSYLMKWIFNKADKVLSTSNCMAMEIKKYTNKQIEITPFGVYTDLFSPVEKADTYKVVIGTIKTLEKKYGVEYLIRAFNIVMSRNNNISLELHIYGEGIERAKLTNLIDSFGLGDSVFLFGKVPYKEVSKYHKSIDIFCALSIEDSESFGVAVVEAMSCGKPCVVSDVAGFKEVVVDGETGFVVKRLDETEAADAIEKLVLNSVLRESMGRAGRQRVENLYDLNDNLNLMINIYKHLYAKND